MQVVRPVLLFALNLILKQEDSCWCESWQGIRNVSQPPRAVGHKFLPRVHILSDQVIRSLQGREHYSKLEAPFLVHVVH